MRTAINATLVKWEERLPQNALIQNSPVRHGSFLFISIHEGQNVYMFILDMVLIVNRASIKHPREFL